MKKILSNSLFTFIIFFIGVLLMTLITGSYSLWANIELALVIIVLMYFISLICSVINFFLLDKNR